MTTQAIPHEQRLNELIDGLIADCINPEALFNRNGALNRKARQLFEHMLQTEKTASSKRKKQK